jgi:hypothetical protein
MTRFVVSIDAALPFGLYQTHCRNHNPHYYANVCRWIYCPTSVSSVAQLQSAQDYISSKGSWGQQVWAARRRQTKINAHCRHRNLHYYANGCRWKWCPAWASCLATHDFPRQYLTSSSSSRCWLRPGRMRKNDGMSGRVRRSPRLGAVLLQVGEGKRLNTSEVFRGGPATYYPRNNGRRSRNHTPFICYYSIL